MTTSQDRQPQSRRALRESERAHSQTTVPISDDEELVESAFDQQIWNSEPTDLPFENTPKMTPAARPAEESLRRPRRSGAARSAAEPAATESPAYRLRDFSPESRGSSFSSTHTAPWTPPSPGSEDLSYQTSVDANRASPQAPPTQIPIPPVGVTEPAPHDDLIEHTLTRRELREMRNSVAAPDAAPPATPLVAPPAPTLANFEASPTQSESLSPQTDELSDPIAQFNSLLQRQQSAPPLVEPPLERPAAPTVQPASVVQPSPVAQPEPAVPPVDTQDPTALKPQPEPVSRRAARRAAEVPVSDVVDLAPAAEPLREVVTAPEVYTAPIGHWSKQAATDEVSDLVGHPHKRDIASSDAITTSALVMPGFPVSMPTTGPVSGTGEILMTGSINLPRSLGVNGLHPSRYDRPDIDDIIDAADRADVAPDSAPVRAVRAVSTYTSSQGLINTKRPKGNNLPMVLSITAGVMMVGVVVLVVVGMVFKIF